MKKLLLLSLIVAPMAMAVHEAKKTPTTLNWKCVNWASEHCLAEVCPVGSTAWNLQYNKCMAEKTEAYCTIKSDSFTCKGVLNIRPGGAVCKCARGHWVPDWKSKKN